jgi:ABC-type branched-subunit amino acid transport system permease subunit
LRLSWWPSRRLAFGYLILRRRGVYFSLLTLALAAMLYSVSFRWTDVTGGENGLGGITRPALLRLRPRCGCDLSIGSSR